MFNDDILLQVNKPGRYIGQEWNLPKKDFDKADIKFALCFPDLYEIGMSNLGIRIIYAILNNLPDVVCERFFSPALDMEKILRDKNMEICSLESKRRLKEFDFIGFSLGHELNYTNVLNILELGSIPLKSSLRNHNYPLVIGGGPCALNPEPMHEFFDLFVLGEAEEAILEIIDIYRKFKIKFKASEINKQDLLIMFSHIEGIYVPSLYEVRYNREGKIEEFKAKTSGIPSKIKKSFIKEMVEFCEDNDVVYIDDEVQAGMGRTGKFFALSNFVDKAHNVVISMAKGLHVAAVLIEDEMNYLEGGRASTTTGYGRLADIAVGYAKLEAILENDGALMKNATKMGKYFKKEVKKINNGMITRVDGLGLLLVTDFETTEIRNKAFLGLVERGIIPLTVCTKGIRWIPPLDIKKQEMDYGIKVLGEVLKEL